MPIHTVSNRMILNSAKDGHKIEFISRIKIQETPDNPMHKIKLLKSFKIEKDQKKEIFFSKSCSLMLLEEMFNVEKEEEDEPAFQEVPEYTGDADATAIEKIEEVQLVPYEIVDFGPNDNGLLNIYINIKQNTTPFTVLGKILSFTDYNSHLSFSG